MLILGNELFLNQVGKYLKLCSGCWQDRLDLILGGRNYHLLPMKDGIFGGGGLGRGGSWCGVFVEDPLLAFSMLSSYALELLRPPFSTSSACFCGFRSQHNFLIGFPQMAPI